MRFIFVPVLATVVALTFLTSCTGLRTGNAVKAGYETERAGGWISRHIPGLKALSDLVPPPSEARMEWDKRQKKQADPPWTP